MANEPHVADIGSVWIMTLTNGGTAVDVSSATTKQIIFVAPDGTSATQTADFTNTGTDGKIQYTTVSGDLDQAGDWKVQANVVISAGTFKSSVERVHVLGNL